MIDHTDAARGGGASTDRGGRDAGQPGPSGQATSQAADTGRSGQEPDDTAEGGASKRKAVDDATAPVTNPGPTS